MVREINAAALEIAASSEGCVLTGYRDPAGIATAGYGHTGRDAVVGKTYSLAQALEWRAADMARAAAFVEARVKVRLNDNQFGALAEFTYNVGAGNFACSTLLRKLNKGDYAAVPAELMRWNRAAGRVMPGLVVRRAKEAALFTIPPTSLPMLLCAKAPPQAPTMLERIRAWLHGAMPAGA